METSTSEKTDSKQVSTKSYDVSQLIDRQSQVEEMRRRILRARQVWNPPPKLTVSEWADEYRKLSSESSAEPGDWRTDRAAYQRGIMDAITDPTVFEIWVEKSAQVGWTEILNNTIGYFVHMDPSPIMLVQPTKDAAEDYSRDRLAPMIRDTPVLHARFSDDRSRASTNTLRHKTFPGGVLSLAISNSPSSLASKPIRIILFDEVDKYPVSARHAGDPIGLGKKRTTGFWNRKTLGGSTPTKKGTSKIDAKFAESDQRYYFVPCGHCGGRQRLVWSQVRWDEGKPETARYVCEHCGVLWSDADRHEAVRRGEWRATKPFKGVAGFHLNELYSPFVGVVDMATNFLEAKKTPETLQQFVNESLGEAFEDMSGAIVEAAPLLERREQYGPENIPADVLMLTVGGDTQDDRVELQLLGWGADEECWIVEQKVFRGDPGKPQLWAEVDEYLLRQFTTEDGRRLFVEAAAIDSGGHNTNAVYNFVVTRKRRRVWAIRGVGGPGKLIWPKKATRTPKSRANVFNVGVDAAKGVLYGRLAKVLEPGPGYIHLPHSADDDLCKQLTSEKSVTKYVKGRPVVIWELRSKGIAQEAQDCWNYGYAAFLGRRGPEIVKRYLRRRPSIRKDAAAPVEHSLSAAAVEPALPEAPPQTEQQTEQQRPQAVERPQKPHWSRQSRRKNWVRSW